jgi:hypothetical protein
MMKVRSEGCREEGDGGVHAEQAATQNSIHVFQDEKLNYLFFAPPGAKPAIIS